MKSYTYVRIQPIIMLYSRLHFMFGFEAGSCRFNGSCWKRHKVGKHKQEEKRKVEIRQRKVKWRSDNKQKRYQTLTGQLEKNQGNWERKRGQNCTLPGKIKEEFNFILFITTLGSILLFSNILFDYLLRCYSTNFHVWNKFIYF